MMIPTCSKPNGIGPDDPLYPEIVAASRTALETLGLDVTPERLRALGERLRTGSDACCCGCLTVRRYVCDSVTVRNEENPSHSPIFVPIVDFARDLFQLDGEAAP
jgi:hypothetical protein